MTIEITRSGTSQLTDTRSTVSSRSNSTDTARTSSSPVRSSAQDVVNITDTAQRLSQIQEQLKTVPVEDNQKITEIRNALNSGNFEIDNERVAEKLINFEIDI